MIIPWKDCEHFLGMLMPVLSCNFQLFKNALSFFGNRSHALQKPEYKGFQLQNKRYP